MLHLSGCIVTIDAMGCQRAIAQCITAQGAGYVLNSGKTLSFTRALYQRTRTPTEA